MMVSTLRSHEILYDFIMTNSHRKSVVEGDPAVWKRPSRLIKTISHD